MGDVAISGRLAGTTLNNGIETLQRAVVGSDGSQWTIEQGVIAGERQQQSTTGADHLAVASEWATKLMAWNGSLAARTIYDGPCLVAGFEVFAAMSAHASDFEDNGVSRYPIPASRGVGTYTFPGPIIFEFNAIWDPGSLTGGQILVFYRPLAPNVKWAY
jgi:hypothetical protein